MPLETEERKRMRRLAEARARKARNVRESKAGNLSATSPNRPSSRAAKSARASSSRPSGRAKTGENFDQGLEAALKAMTPAQRKAYEKSLGQSSSAAERRKKEREFLESGGTKSKDYAGSAGGFRKATAADVGSGSGAPRLPAKKAAARKAAARKAPAKKSAAKRSPAKKAASKKGFLDRLGEGFKKATARTGKPNKRMFQRGARMTPGEKRKYEAAMKRWEKKNK